MNGNFIALKCYEAGYILMAYYFKAQCMRTSFSLDRSCDLPSDFRFPSHNLNRADDAFYIFKAACYIYMCVCVSVQPTSG